MICKPQRVEPEASHNLKINRQMELQISIKQLVQCIYMLISQRKIQEKMLSMSLPHK